MARVGELLPGDKVRRRRLWDGSRWAGQPTGPVLTVERIEDHRPIETNTVERDVVAILSDGGWSFVWNLTKEVVE